MTVTNQTNKIATTGSGDTGQEVPFNFPITSTSELIVKVRVRLTGVSTTLMETTNYTVVIDDDNGGTLTTVTAVDTADDIHLMRQTKRTQQLDLAVGGSFSSEDQEAAFDKNTKLSIDNASALDRTLHIPDTDDSSIVTGLPSSIDRASKNLGFDSAGNVIASSVVQTGETTFTDLGTDMAETLNAKSAKVLLNLDRVANVRDFGAVGDGTVDDQPAIQLAIDSFENGDGVVIIPMGFYKCLNPLTIYRGTRLIGVKQRQGRIASATFGPTKLYFVDCDGIQTPIGWSSVGAGALDRAHGCVIENMTIAGDDRTNSHNGVLLRDNDGGEGDVHPGLIKFENVSIIEFDVCLNLNGDADGTTFRTGDIGLCRIGIIGGKTDDLIDGVTFFDVSEILIDTSCNVGIYTNLELYDKPDNSRAIGINIRPPTGGEGGTGRSCTVSTCHSSGANLVNCVVVGGVNSAKIVDNSLDSSAESIVFDDALEFICVGNAIRQFGLEVDDAPTPTPAIWVTGDSMRGVVDNNTIGDGGPRGLVGVQIDSDAFDIEIGANPVHTNVTTPLLDSGTRTRIASTTLIRQTGGAEVVETTGEGDLYLATLPANTLRSGRSLRLTMQIDYLNNSGGNSEVTYKVYLGTTVILDTGALDRAANANRSAVVFHVDIQARASDTVARGSCRFAAVDTVGGTMSTLEHDLFGGYNAIDEDLTTALVLKITAKHETSAATISTIAQSWMLELL